MIPVFKPLISKQGLDEVIGTLKSGWWGQGPKVQEFEKRFAQFVGAKYAVATNSCTAALDIAVRLVPFKNPVTVPAFTFVSSALAPLNAGYRLEFVDINEETLCADYADIIVHYGGNSAGEGTVHDMAHCAGTKHKDPISCWSFHAVKNLPCGDGGMITFNDRILYEKAKALAWCGIDKSTWGRTGKRYSWDYDIKDKGLKASMNDITATIGLDGLRNLRKYNQRRREIAYLYTKWLPKIAKKHKSATWHLYTIRVPQRDELIDYLGDRGIATSVHYKPLYYYPIFGKQKKLPITEKIFKEILTLPMFPELKNREVKYICEKIKEFFGN